MLDYSRSKKTAFVWREYGPDKNEWLERSVTGLMTSLVDPEVILRPDPTHVCAHDCVYKQYSVFNTMVNRIFPIPVLLHALLKRIRGKRDVSVRGRVAGAKE